MAASPLRKEDARLLRGQARCVDDVHLDRMLHAVFIRSPMPHAEIVGIDGSAALAAGAALVLTAADLPFIDKPWVVRYWHPKIRNGMPKFLATDRVRYVGEPVALLVAEDRYLAEDLAALVEVDYRPLPPLASVEDARAPGAPILHPEWDGNVAAAFRLEQGDADAALAGSVHLAKGRFTFGRQTPLPLECRGVVADYDADRGDLTVWMSTQAHYNVRQNLATVLGLPEYQVRVIAEDVGGGFGAKSRTYAEELVISHASRVLRRPVKWIEDRLENLQATTHSRGVTTEIEIGCDAEGRFTGLRASVVLDLGGYVFTSGIMTAEIAGAHLPNCYRFPHQQIDVQCVGTNKTPIATYRGAGQPEAVFPIESLVDRLAKRAGLAAAELRRRNLVTPADLPHRLGTTIAGLKVAAESGDFPALFEAAVADSGYSEEVQDLPDGRRLAWGLAAAIEASGLVNFETANIRIDGAGLVTVFCGMTTQGQGQPTTYAQVCAEALGVQLDRVAVRMGDTQLVPFGRGAFASRGAIFGANAVLGAAQALRDKALGCAGQLLQCDPGELRIEEGRICRAGAGPTEIDLAAIAQAVGPGGQLFSGDAALEAQYVFKSDQPVTYGMTVHVAQVSLDPRTGFFAVKDYLVAHDAGRVLNAMIVDGQIVGGAVDGIGGALFSELLYDGEGQLLTGSLADYMVATAPDVPRLRLVHHETRPGTNPLGVRGIGEGGTIAPGAAIANALSRAIDPHGSAQEAGLSVLPLSPERVFAACRAAGR